MDVKLIMKKNDVALVEHRQNGKVIRVAVPLRALSIAAKGGGIHEIDADVLDEGIPYGVPFEALIQEFTLTPEQIADELHKVDIWTPEEFFNKPKDVQSSLLAVLRPLMQSLTMIVKEYNRK